ncbi:hypothetical protein V6N13_135502 [Hibiscus sabdariffa]|uniref:Uncharacterized protein n=1 Tax=Hibiscus sabdariffa TaxID=183260 RepID=A0ABR2R726_9ROSI
MYSENSAGKEESTHNLKKPRRQDYDPSDKGGSMQAPHGLNSNPSLLPLLTAHIPYAESNHNCPTPIHPDPSLNDVLKQTPSPSSSYNDTLMGDSIDN